MSALQPSTSIRGPVQTGTRCTVSGTSHSRGRGEVLHECMVGSWSGLLGVVLRDEEAHRTRLGQNVRAVLVLAPAFAHQLVLAGHVGLPEAAAFVALVTGRRHGGGDTFRV